MNMNYYLLYPANPQTQLFGRCTQTEILQTIKTLSNVKGVFLSGNQEKEEKHVQEIVLAFTSYTFQEIAKKAIDQKCFVTS